MTFLIAAAAIFALSLFAIGRALFRAPESAGSTAAHDLTVYRAQLAEVARDAARGLLTPPEAEAARTQIGRKILTADRRMAGGDDAPTAAPRGANMAVLTAVGALFLAGAAAYLFLGVPGYRDLPLSARLAQADRLYETRPTQQQAETEAAKQRPAPAAPDPKFDALMAQLRAAVAARPNDPAGLALLARNELALGNYAAARDAQAKLVAAKGAGASADDLAMQGEIDVNAAGGLVTASAEAPLQAALKRDPKNIRALYFLGLMMAQNGRPDRAFQMWATLLDQAASAGPDDAPMVTDARRNIQALALAAGVSNYQPPAAPAASGGPTADDMAAAGQMSAADRAEMIRGMVSRLSDRLAADGGPPADWARLVSSLRMIGEADKAAAIAAEARQKFAADADALAQIARAEQAALGAALEPAQ